MRFEEIREQYPRFVYHGYHMEETQDAFRFWFDFEICGLAKFHPSWSIDKKFAKHVEEEDEIIQKLIFSIGMVELISYWKITCSPCVEIYAAGLSKEQIDWWKKQYYWGLGEFFYTNQIEVSEEDFMHIQTFGNAFADTKGKKSLHGCLIPVGGGKDSVVTLELLQSWKQDSYCYIMNPRGASENCAAIAGYGEDRILRVKRTLDPEMLRLNAMGFLNGHTPFSALVAFSTTLYAYLNGIKYVVLSNEDSANESTVDGTQINHQYSKSFQFEQDFQAYEKHFIGSQVYYFSLLRGWSEFQIARAFARYKQYHNVFRSCNAGSKQDIWCAKCPKCLFVYLILLPFLSDEEEIAIFHENLLEKAELLPIMEQLIGYQKEKPFECVGSRDEVNVALCMKIHALQADQRELPLLLKHYVTLPQYQQYKDQGNPYDRYFNTEHAIPEVFLDLVKEGDVCASDH